VIPVEAWLQDRLKGISASARAITGEAIKAGYTLADVLIGKKALQIQSQPMGNKGTVLWFLPGFNPPKPAASEVTVKRTPRTPEESTRLAHNLIKRAAPTAARTVRELVQRSSKDAEACPACGRGMPREEELRLKAATTLLDRSGLSPARAPSADDGSTGPLIIFPPGTQIAILARTPGPEDGPGVSRPEIHDLKVTRGDRVGESPRTHSESPEVDS
jgi:hypothetical protein